MDTGAGALNEQALGKRLQEARQAAGLTQQQLCHKANLSYSTLAKIERGAIKSPSIFTIQSIAAALGTGLDDLLGGLPSPTPARNLLKTKSGVSFIYFDVNGCLVRSYNRAFTRLAELAGRPADMVESVFWHNNDAACRGTMSISDFNTTLADKIGLESVDWYQYYLEEVEAVVEMQDLLKWAAERYKVGLFSNIMPGLISAMRERELLPNLNYDVIVDSSEVGAIKPETKIYEIGQERAGCPPEEILLIDDTRANLMAAESHGWKVLWFDGYFTNDSVTKLREALEPSTP